MNYAFTSDNTAPATPEIVASITAANEGAMLSYGDDPWTARLQQAATAAFEAPEPVSIVPILSGKLANHLALASITEPGGVIFCHEHSHISFDENGGPAYVTRCRLIPLAGDGDKIAPETLRAAIAIERPLPPHSVLSLTTITEAGQIYTLDEMRVLTAIAREAGMLVHLDGARISNAAAALNCNLADMTWRVGIDVLSLGATKNGGLSAEAVVAFGAANAKRLTEKQMLLCHFPSKMRFLSAQLLAWLENDGWRTRAANANRTAQRLATAFRTMPGVTIGFPVEANILFVELPEEVKARLTAAAYFVYSSTQFGDRYSRFVTNWATTDDDIDRLVAAMTGAY
jgi:threonine aldolase